MVRTIVVGSNTNSIHKQYDIGQQIGTGKFSVVNQGVNKNNGKKAAIKIMKKSMVEEQAIIKEVEMMTEIKHPNIISLEEVFETDNEILMVLELVTGGELFDKIVEREFYTEQDASMLIRTVTKVIQYLHSKDIVHCDLKPENLLYSDNSDQAIIKLCDFGLSQRCGSGTPLRSLVGTLTYMAPEISSCTGYGKPVDLWSLGVIAYILLCGFPPFDETTGYNLEFPSPEWDNISDSSKSLIKGLLTNDPSKRFTIETTLKHPWIAGTSCGKNSIVGTLKTLREFNTLRRTNGGTTTMGHNKQSRGTVFELFPSLTPIKSVEIPLQSTPIQSTEINNNNNNSSSVKEEENEIIIKKDLENEFKKQQQQCTDNNIYSNNNVILETTTTTTTAAITTTNINEETTSTNNNETIIDESINKTKIQLMNSLDYENDSSSSETYSSSPLETADKFTSPELLSSLSIDLGCAPIDQEKEKIIEQLKNEKSILEKELQEIKRQSPVPLHNHYITSSTSTTPSSSSTTPSSSSNNIPITNTNNSSSSSSNNNNNHGNINGSMIGGSSSVESATRQFRPIHLSKDNSDGSYENLLLGTSPLLKSHISHSRNSSFGGSGANGGSGGSGDESFTSKKDKSKYGVDKICSDLQYEFEKLSLPKENMDKISNILLNYKQKNQEKSLKLKLEKQKEKYKKLKAQLKKDKSLLK